MTHKKYTLSLNGLPTHEHIIFKLICSVSERTKNRTQHYTIENNNNMSDIYINDINYRTSTNKTDTLPLNVWVSNTQENEPNVIQRPLIATRVLHALDSLVNACIENTDKNTQTAPDANEIETQLTPTDTTTSIDFNISEEEASELAIVHDEILENPANQTNESPINDVSARSPDLMLINGTASRQHTLKSETNSLQVLVVDDSPSVRKQLEIELDFFDVSVDFAESAESAFNLLSTKKYDLALLDVVLPDRDGFQICKHLKSEDKSTIAIMLTGKATQADKIKGSLAGCNAYLVKPVGRQTFQNTVRNYLPLKPTKEAAKA